MDLYFLFFNRLISFTIISCFQRCLFVFTNYTTSSVADFETLGDYSVYYSFNRTKEVLMKYYHRSEEIKKLVDEYEFRCANIRHNFTKNFPFITIEAAYRKTRNVVAQRVARRIGARMVGNPPQFMTLSKYFFNDTAELRRAFYSLGVYAASCRVKEFLATSTVVVAGYWVDQTAFGVAKLFGTLPPETSPVYQWPQDLLRPDKVYLINTGSSFSPVVYHLYRPKRVNSFKEKLLEATSRFKDPLVIEINTTSDYEDIVRVTLHLVNRHFNTSFSVR